jgi:hypothetical protein
MTSDDMGGLLASGNRMGAVVVGAVLVLGVTTVVLVLEDSPPGPTAVGIGTEPPGFVSLVADPEYIEPTPAGAVEPGVELINAYPSESLDAVAGLFPFQWPWFSDRVPTPVDALAGGQDLVAAITETPALEGFKILSAEQRLIAGQPDLAMRSAWLKVNDTELLRIGTQLVTPDVSVPQEGTVTNQYGGQADVWTKTGAVYTKLLVGDRLVLVDLQSTTGATVLSMTPDELLAIGYAIITAYGA